MYINTRSIIFRKYLYNKHNNVRLTIFRNKNGKLIYIDTRLMKLGKKNWKISETNGNTYVNV